jgi:hypothetical protein
LKIKIYKTIILPVLLYGCETWSLTLREEFRLRVIEYGILRRIFGPKTDDNEEWKGLNNEKLHVLNPSPNIIRLIRRHICAGHIVRMEEGRRAFKILIFKTKETDLQEVLGVVERTMLEWNLNKYVSIRGNGLIQLRIEIIGEPLWVRH